MTLRDEESGNLSNPDIPNSEWLLLKPSETLVWPQAIICTTTPPPPTFPLLVPHNLHAVGRTMLIKMSELVTKMFPQRTKKGQAPQVPTMTEAGSSSSGAATSSKAGGKTNKKKGKGK